MPMSNFDFLTINWPALHATAIEAEQNVASAPLSHRALCRQTSCFYTRRSLEIAVKWLYAGSLFSVVAFFARTQGLIYD